MRGGTFAIADRRFNKKLDELVYALLCVANELVLHSHSDLADRVVKAAFLARDHCVETLCGGGGDETAYTIERSLGALKAIGYLVDRVCGVISLPSHRRDHIDLLKSSIAEDITPLMWAEDPSSSVNANNTESPIVFKGRC